MAARVLPRKRCGGDAMIIGVANYKGGVGKTTTAVHLAAYLQDVHGRVLLLDGDATCNATNCNKRGPGFPFTVAPIEAAAMLEGYAHKVIDTGQKPGLKDLLALAQYCDLLVVPSPPEGMDSDGLGQTIRALRTISKPNGEPVEFKVLFTRVPHFKSRKVARLREELKRGYVPMFATEIPRLDVFDKAATEGMLVGAVEDESAARAWAAYAAVGKELIDGHR
jgi:chromosome partitioning protein